MGCAETDMTTSPSLSRYSRREEIASAVTHGIGVVLSIAGLSVLAVLAVLVGFSAVRGEAWLVAACSVFGGTKDRKSNGPSKPFHDRW